VANRLPFPTQCEIIAHLSDGAGVRATSRLVGVSKGAVLRLLVSVGTGCIILHDNLVHGVEASIVEADELFTFVAKKEGRKTAMDPIEYGDAYTWTAMDVVSRMIVSYLVGKREPNEARMVMLDLRDRIIGRPHISTDGLGSYEAAIREAFGPEGADHGVVVKDYEKSISRQMNAATRYSPGRVKAVAKYAVMGEPDHDLIGTSHMERVNLSFRTEQRRFVRLGLGFTKKFENLVWSVGLFVMKYNFVRVHMSLKTTPAVAAGLTSRPWTIAELTAAALAAAEEDAGKPEASPVAPSPRLLGPALAKARPAAAPEAEDEDDAPPTLRDPIPWGSAVA
jgi:IS1 family transposase